MINPLVSVIIPSYNHAKYISKAIESVFSQTYRQWELIVIDDGSSDETCRVLRQFEGQDKVQIIINPENKGQGAVINQALLIAQGDYICFLPSDDWYLPRKLELQVAKFKESMQSVGVVYGRGARFYEDSGKTIEVNQSLLRGNVLRYLITEGNFVYPITPMFKTEVFKTVRFDESYRAEGEAIYLKIAQRFEFDYVDEVVGVMRDHGYNTGKNTDMMYADNLRYWTEFFSQDSLTPDVKSLKDWRIGRLMRLKGIELITLRGRYAEGRNILMDAVRLNPNLWLDFRVVGAIVISMLPRRAAVIAVKVFSSKKN